MNYFDYVAAEYFVDTISKTYNNKLYFHNFQMVRNLLGRDISLIVSEYLGKKSRNDFLYIFKTFPDAFDIKEDSISLTETFLSLYNLNKSFVSTSFHFINCYVKNFAIDYFRKILATQGPKPCSILFNMLITDDTHRYARYFFHFSTSEVLLFFLSYPGYFTVINQIVFLTARKHNDQGDAEAMKFFEISVYFLLTCYESMHYFHLKQCLSYVETGTKHILDRISLIRQRELFAILPVVTMDVSGFLTLKNKTISIALPDVNKTILLLVCILAFKKEMYIVDLVAEFSNRMLPTINPFSNLTFDEQLNFIKQYPMYFHVSYTGHISLLPEWLFPQSPDLQTVDSSIIRTDKNSDDSSTSTHLSNSSPIKMSKNGSSTITSHVEQIQYADSSLAPKDLLCVPGLSEILVKKIKHSFYYLSKYFHPLDMKKALHTLLHSVDDVRISFCSFSDKNKFVTECYNFINYLSEEHIEATASERNDLLAENEKKLLFIVYILGGNEPMHFVKLIEAMEKHKIDDTLVRSTVSDQFKYFKSLSGYIEVCSNGQINFPSTFLPIKSIVEHESAQMVSQDKKPSSKKTASKDKIPLVSFENKNGKSSKALSWVADVVPLKQKFSNALRDEDPSCIKVSVDLPDTICKALTHCGKLLRKYYEYAATIHILKATLFSVTDAYNYICGLPLMADQHVFAEKCFKYLNEESHDYSTQLSSEEREILFITYILLKSEYRRMHYRKMVIELRSCNCRKASQLLVDKLQFHFFKNLDEYFAINSDGFVSLNLLFPFIDDVVNVAVNRTAKSQSLLKRSGHKSESLSRIDHKQPTLKSVCTAELPCLSSSTNSSVNNKNSKKLERSESDFEMQETSSKRINVDADTRDVVIDYMFCILSVCKKMSIEKLCYRLNSFNIKGIQNMFSSFTVTEKLNFFKSLSPYFEVTKDDFVSLKMDADKFVQRSNVNLTELFKKISSTSESSSNISKSRSESEKSSDVSEFWESVSTASDSIVTRRVRRRGRKRHKNAHNRISYDVHKVTDKAMSAKPVKKNFSKSSLGLQITCSAENALKMHPSSPASKENECSTMRDINKDDEISKSTPEIEIVEISDDEISNSTPEIEIVEIKVDEISKSTLEIVKMKEIKKLGLTDADSHMSIDQTPELCGKKDNSHMSIDQTPELCGKKDKGEKLVECQSKLSSSLENAKLCSLSISGGIQKLKLPRQPVKESLFSKLSKPSLLKNSPEKNKCSEIDNSSVNNIDVPVVNDCEPTPVCGTLELKSNLLNVSASVTVTQPDTENIPSFKEIDEALQKCSMPLGDNFHEALKDHKGYQAYISNLIDEFLYSAKTEPLDQGTSNLNNEHQVNYTSSKDQTSGLNSIASQSTKVVYQCTSKAPDDKKNSSSNSGMLLKNESKNLPKCTKASETVPPQNLAPVLKNCDKTPDVSDNVVSNKPMLDTAQRNSNPEKMSVLETVIEGRAVTFYILMLKNYQKYDESVNVDFLKSHISQASAEVQSFMLKHYGDDFMPFFQKHSRVFFVSPMTHCVYFANRKSFPKMRLNLS